MITLSGKIYTQGEFKLREILKSLWRSASNVNNNLTLCKYSYDEFRFLDNN